MDYITKLIRKPYGIEILKLCKAGNSIKDISEEIGITYKATFLRINKLYKAGIITKKVHGTAESAELDIADKYNELVSKEILMYDFNLKSLFSAIKSTSIKNIFKHILNEDRYFYLEDYAKINSYEFAELVNIRTNLEQLGFVKTRSEMTKSGKKFFKSLK